MYPSLSWFLAIAAVLALLYLLYKGQTAAQSSGFLQQQLEALRAQLTEATLRQNEVVGQELHRLSEQMGRQMDSVSKQLNDSQKNVGDRLDSAARLVGDVQKPPLNRLLDYASPASESQAGESSRTAGRCFRGGGPAPKAQGKLSVVALGHDLALFSLHGAQVIVFREREELARRLADYVMFIYLGELVEHGPAREVLENPREALTREYIKGVIS